LVVKYPCTIIVNRRLFLTLALAANSQTVIDNDFSDGENHLWVNPTN
jgi:hypothetical protein